MPSADPKQQIEQALAGFATKPLAEAALVLVDAMIRLDRALRPLVQKLKV